MAQPVDGCEQIRQIAASMCFDDALAERLADFFNRIGPYGHVDLRSGQARGLTTIVNPAPAPDTPVTGLDAASILVPNETEARVLLELAMDDPLAPVKLARALHNKSGAGEVIITLGEQGAVGTDGQEVWSVTSPIVEAVDTSGAGDAFCAALAVGLVEGQTVQQAAQWACGVAALSVTCLGTIPAYPTRQAVDRFLS